MAVRHIALAALALAIVAVPAISAAQDGGESGDDWVVVERRSVDQSAPQGQVQGQAPQAGTQPAARTLALSTPEQISPRAEVNACGELARPAGEPYRSIVAELNEMWGSDAQIYESVANAGPHARGNCIFYNRTELQMLMHSLMGIDDPDQVEPMLYAIMAHELGHIVHGDLTPARAGVALETRELEADRFAGYSLWRLKMPRFDAQQTEFYYQTVGDDFVGASGSHGTGKQRISAFQDGWDLARMGLPEDDQRPVGGLDAGN